MLADSIHIGSKIKERHRIHCIIIVCGIMRHLRQNCSKPEIDSFKDPEFADFRASLDTDRDEKTPKCRCGFHKKKQAEPLTMEDEEILWERKLLDDHSPEALLNTMVYMNVLYFALWN